MLDIKFLRQNPDVVKENIKKKFQDEKLPLVDEVIELDKRNREIKGEVEALRAEKIKFPKKSVHAWLMAKKRKQKSLRKKFRKTLPVWKNFLPKKKKLKQKSKRYDGYPKYHRSICTDRQRRQPEC